MSRSLPQHSGVKSVSLGAADALTSCPWGEGLKGAIAAAQSVGHTLQCYDCSPKGDARRLWQSRHNPYKRSVSGKTLPRSALYQCPQPCRVYVPATVRLRMKAPALFVPGCWFGGGTLRTTTGVRSCAPLAAGVRVPRAGRARRQGTDAAEGNGGAKLLRN